jgi:hypothetical protein
VSRRGHCWRRAGVPHQPRDTPLRADGAVSIRASRPGR